MKLYFLVKWGSYYLIVDSPNGDEYWFMRIKAGEPDQVRSVFPKEDYKDREHFAGVIGKFMPEIWVWGEGYEIEIEELSLPELRRAEKIANKRNEGATDV